MPICPRSNSGEHGFTLIELLVVLTILSLLAVAIAAHLGRRSSALERQQIRARLDAALRSAARGARETGSAVAVEPVAIGKGVAFAPALVGGREGVIIVYPDGSSTGGLALIDDKPFARIDWLTARIQDAP